MISETVKMIHLRSERERWRERAGNVELTWGLTFLAPFVGCGQRKLKTILLSPVICTIECHAIGQVVCSGAFYGHNQRLLLGLDT